MKYIFFIFFLFHLSGTSKAQVYKPVRERILFQFSPFMMIDPIPRWRTGIEYAKGKWSYNITCGIGNSFFNGPRLKNTIYDRDFALFEIRPEVKYFQFMFGDRLIAYYAGEFFYVHTRATLTDDHYTPEDGDTEIFYEKARFVRHKTGIHAKAGLKIQAGNWLEIDFYFGLGAVFRRIQYHALVNPVFLENYFEDWFPRRYAREGKSSGLHPTMGLKAGFILDRN